MLIDWKKPIETETGKAARFLGEIRASSGFRFVVALDLPEQESVAIVDGDGNNFFELFPRPPGPREFSVRNVPPPKRSGVAWVNVYPDGLGGAYLSRRKSDMEADPGRIASVRVAWTEGQFDE